MKFLFQGLYQPDDGENLRVQVQVPDLQYFLSNNGGTIFAAARIDGEWTELGEISRHKVIFDDCRPERCDCD